MIEAPTRRPTAANSEDPRVIIVDDDASICAALSGLFRSVGLQASVFTSARELLKSPLLPLAGCIVLDIRMPGGSGLDLQEELAEQGYEVPIVFLTGYGDIPMTVKAMKSGAVDFLTKPFRDQDLLDAVSQALSRDRQRRSETKSQVDLQNLYLALTPREREVMSLVAKGLMNKQIASEIGVTEITVKVHRGRVMKKMGANSLADLVRVHDVLRGAAGGRARD
jgi:FixJ family two-component response regulator